VANPDARQIESIVKRSRPSRLDLPSDGLETPASSRFEGGGNQGMGDARQPHGDESQADRRSESKVLGVALSDGRRVLEKKAANGALYTALQLHPDVPHFGALRRWPSISTNHHNFWQWKRCPKTGANSSHIFESFTVFW
jgi:hypothetical protein